MVNTTELQRNSMETPQLNGGCTATQDECAIAAKCLFNCGTLAVVSESTLDRIGETAPRILMDAVGAVAVRGDGICPRPNDCIPNGCRGLC